jgi:hypothetical protein
MAKFVDRVADQARTVRPLRLLLTVLALPFYVLGWLLGLVVVVVMYAVGAVKVGLADARSVGGQRAAESAADEVT